MEYLGDIIAGDKGAKIMIVEKPDQVIQLNEQKMLRKKFLNSLNTIKYMLENKYALETGIL